MTVYLIRHGQTQWNTEDRFLGLTDMPLSELGIQTAKTAKAPEAELIFRSPLLRCAQTADIMFPGREKIIVNDLRECDFGDFEGKSSSQLAHDKAYLSWIGSRCVDPIPGGESVDGFMARCCAAFEATLRSHSDAKSLAFVVHGGVIMALLHCLNVEKHAFNDYHIGNCAVIGCSCELGGAPALTVTSGKCL